MVLSTDMRKGMRNPEIKQIRQLKTGSPAFFRITNQEGAGSPRGRRRAAPASGTVTPLAGAAVKVAAPGGELFSWVVRPPTAVDCYAARTRRRSKSSLARP